MSPQSTPRKHGWELVRDALLAAPKHTLTNAQLGEIRGVQAFHQRISDLRRRGYVVAGAVRVNKGRYAYRLLGTLDSSIAASDGVQGLPTITHDAMPVRVREAEQDMREHPPTETTIRLPKSTSDTLREHREREASIAKALAEALGIDESDPVKLASIAAGVIVEAGPGGDDHEQARAEVRGLQERNAELEAENERLRGLTGVDSSSAAADVVTAHRERVAANTERVLTARNRLAEALGEPTTDSLMEGLDLTALAERAADTLAAKPQRAARQPRAERGPTGPQLMRQVLEEAGVPMHSKVIAERVLAAGGDAIYKGNTPTATMAAQLATSNKQGGEFVKVAPGCFAVREWPQSKLDAEPVRS